MESVVAHDHLFRFRAWRGGSVHVVESNDARVRRLAMHEIRVFRKLVKEA